jgi:hypothetical protein
MYTVGLTLIIPWQISRTFHTMTCLTCISRPFSVATTGAIPDLHWRAVVDREGAGG